jgi:O-antigen ligase
MMFDRVKFERELYFLLGFYMWTIFGAMRAEFGLLARVSTVFLLKVQLILVIVAIRCCSFKRMRFYLFILVVGTAFLVLPSLLGANYLAYEKRLEGATGASNSLGHIAAISAVIWIMFMVYIKSWWKRILSICMIVLSLRVLLLTGSRGGFIVAAGSLGVLLWHMWRRGKVTMKILIPVLIVTGFVCLLIYGQELVIVKRLAAIPVIFGFEVSSPLVGASVDVSRIAIIKASLKLFLQYPFLGAGYGTFAGYSKFDYTHTTPFELLFATGIVGTFLYYYVIVSALIVFHRAKKYVMDDPWAWHNIEICQTLIMLQLFAGISIPTPASKVQAIVSGIWLGVAWHVRSLMKHRSEYQVELEDYHEY